MAVSTPHHSSTVGITGRPRQSLTGLASFQFGRTSTLFRRAPHLAHTTRFLK